MKMHVEEKVCLQDEQRAWDAEEAYQRAVTRDVDSLLASDWEVREGPRAFRIIPADRRDSAGAIAVVQKREGREDVNRKLADAIAMLPWIIRLLEEAGLCIEELLHVLPEGARVPPRTAVFISRMAAVEEAERGGAHA